MMIIFKTILGNTDRMKKQLITILMISWRKSIKGCAHGVMVIALDCRIIVSEFNLQSHYYVHFQKNTLGKRYEPLYPPRYGLNSTTTILLKDGFDIN